MKADNHRREIPEATWACRFNAGRLLWLPAILLALAGLLNAQSIPVKERINPGEEVEYELYFKWGLLMPRAGHATLSVNNTQYEGKPACHYRLLFYTSGLFEKVYKMRDTLECYFTPDMLLLRGEKRVNENNYYLIDDIRFSYDDKKIFAHSRRYTPTRSKIDTTLVSTNKYVFDMLGATLYLRSIDWDEIQSGDEFPFQIAIGRDLVNISYRYTGQQIVERGNTKYSTRHFYIDIYDEAFTQSKEAAEIWVGDDKNRIPVKIRAKLKIGAAEVYYKSSRGLRYPLTSRVVIPKR